MAVGQVQTDCKDVDHNQSTWLYFSDKPEYEKSDHTTETSHCANKESHHEADTSSLGMFDVQKHLKLTSSEMSSRF